VEFGVSAAKKDFKLKTISTPSMWQSVVNKKKRLKKTKKECFRIVFFSFFMSILY
jgi:hypothetical protein